MQGQACLVAVAFFAAGAAAFHLQPRVSAVSTSSQLRSQAISYGMHPSAFLFPASSRRESFQATRTRLSFSRRQDPDDDAPIPPPATPAAPAAQPQSSFLDDQKEAEEEDYSAMTRLREEAESPFRSLRFLVYGGVGASGAVGALTSITGALAAYTGVRGAVPLSQSGKDIAIDLGAIALAAVAWKLDSQTKARKLGRLSRGAKIAALKVQLQEGGEGGRAGERPVLSLADFRRDRGRARRVVIVAGGEEVVQTALAAAGAAELKQRLVDNAFLVVPVVLPAGPKEPSSILGLAQERLQGAVDEPHVGCPLLLREWQEYLAIEAAEARKQGIDPVKQGISVVLKLNGRVGQRAFGQPAWERLVGDVERRRRRGLDVTNI